MEEKQGSVKSDSISLLLSLQCTRTTLGPELGECSRYYLKIKHQSLDGSEMIKAFLHVRYCFVPLHASRVMAKYQIQVVEGRERVGGEIEVRFGELLLALDEVVKLGIWS